MLRAFSWLVECLAFLSDMTCIFGFLFGVVCLVEKSEMRRLWRVLLGLLSLWVAFSGVAASLQFQYWARQIAKRTE